MFRREPAVKVAVDVDIDDDDDVDADVAPSDAAVLESIVVQEMLKRMRPDLFTADVMSEIRESAQIMLDARNEAPGIYCT